jgi:hypothetical protein
MSANHDGYGAALENAAAEILRISETPGGPVTLALHNQGTGDLVPTVSRKSDGAHVALAEETAIADEDTVYNGDTSTLAFSGESLDNTPIVPGTVTVKPPVGGQSVNATDRDGDGKLYTDDNDEDECGSINYFTGALVLNYPTGKAPNTGDIDADYSHMDAVCTGLGKKTYAIQNVVTGGSFETLLVKVAGSVNSECRVEAFQSF